MGMKYRRVVLKLSGEALAGEGGFGISSDVVKAVAEQIREATALGVQVAVVVGGGNIWRGARRAAKEWNARTQITWGCWRPC